MKTELPKSGIAAALKDLSPAKRYLIGVSGGRDSVALLHLLLELGFKKPIVVCCASGARSEKAASILKSKGIKEVYNGGSWTRVLKMMKSL